MTSRRSLTLLTAAVAVTALSILPRPARTSFARDVEPILRENCVSCHGVTGPSEGLNLATFAGIRKGSAGGPVVVPGEPDRSSLATRLIGHPGKPAMPRGAAALKPEQIELIRNWIAEGATDGEITPYKPSGIYAEKETVGWNVAGSYTYVLKKNNFETVRTGEVTDGKVEFTSDVPAMVTLELTPKEGGRPLVFGAAIEPQKLKPVVEKPKDFDAFWKRKLADLAAIPENPVLTPGESYKPEVEYATIRMDHVNGTHVYGQIAKPKAPGKYPAIVQFQWASPPYPLQKPWVIEPAGQGFLALNIEPHNVLPTESADYYRNLPNELKSYTAIGREDRETSYFVEMALRDARAVEYLAKRPDWDGKTLIVIGTSMGGQQCFYAAGLSKKVTHLIVNEPAGCDMNAALHGRQQGYPNFNPNEPKTMAAAQYVDPINFASRIHATCLVAMGFVDTAAPPAGIWTAFNEIKGSKEAAPMVDSPHNNLATPAQQLPYNQRAAEWLNALAKGQPIPIIR